MDPRIFFKTETCFFLFRKSGLQSDQMTVIRKYDEAYPEPTGFIYHMWKMNDSCSTYLLDFCFYILQDDLVVAVMSGHQCWNALWEKGTRIVVY